MSQAVVKITIEPPKGGRIHVVEHIPLVIREWTDAIFTAAPQSYRGVGLELPDIAAAFGMKPALQPEYFTAVLVHFGDDSSVNGPGAVEWASSQKSRLCLAGTYHVCSVAEYKPNLDRDIGDDICLIATELGVGRGSTFAANVLWHRGCRFFGLAEFTMQPTKKGTSWYTFVG